MGVSPNFAFTLMALPPLTNRIVVDRLLPATVDGAAKVRDSVSPDNRHVPEALIGVAENMAVNVPFELNSMTSLSAQEVVPPSGSRSVAGQSADWVAVAIDV